MGLPFSHARKLRDRQRRPISSNYAERTVDLVQGVQVITAPFQLPDTTGPLDRNPARALSDHMMLLYAIDAPTFGVPLTDYVVVARVHPNTVQAPLANPANVFYTLPRNSAGELAQQIRLPYMLGSAYVTLAITRAGGPVGAQLTQVRFGAAVLAQTTWVASQLTTGDQPPRSGPYPPFVDPSAFADASPRFKDAMRRYAGALAELAQEM